MAANTYLSVSEAARLLGVSRTTVWRWIGKGRLRAYRVGGRTIRIRDLDVQQQLQEVNPTGLPPGVDRQSIWANYDPEKARESLRRGFGALEGIDVEKLKKEIREGRGHLEDDSVEYDPAKALAALRSMRGILKGVDRDQLQRDIREGRSQADRPRRD